MIQTYFDNIEKVLLSALTLSKSRIFLAVAWFTNQNLLECLINALSRNIKVKVLILDHILNRNEFGLDFGKLVACGAEVRFMRPNKGTMHNKFCVIDDNVITGSYNWTYQANFNNENIVVIDDFKVVESFYGQFELLFNAAVSINLPYEHLKWSDIKENEFEEFYMRILGDISANNDENKEIKQTKLISLKHAYKKRDDEELAFVSSLSIHKHFKTITDVLINHCQDYKYKLWNENIEGKKVNNVAGYTRVGKWVYIPNEIKEDDFHKEYIEGQLKPNIVRDNLRFCGLNLKIYDIEFIASIKYFLGSQKLSVETRKNIPNSLLQIEMAKMFLFQFPSPMYNKDLPILCPNGMPRLRAGINLLGIVKEINGNENIFFDGWNPEKRGEIIQKTYFIKA